MIDRRRFLRLVLFLPVAAAFPGEALLAPHAERRFRPAAGNEDAGSIQVEVELAWNERKAEMLRREEGNDPFDGLRGEFYIVDSRSVDLPCDLPGSAKTFHTIVGAAGVEGAVHVGGFRRETYVWTVRVSNGLMGYLVDAANAIAGFELPDPASVRLGSSSLEASLPGPEHFRGTVEIDPGKS